MDPSFNPGTQETRQVYGITLEQRRNDAKIDAETFGNIVSKNKNVRSGLTFRICSRLLTTKILAALA